MTKTRSFKRALALLLCLVMFVTLLPTAAFAELPIPKMVSAAASGTAIVVTWNTVSGAGGYRLYRKTEGTSWNKIADVMGGSIGTYTDASAAEKVTYTYTVRALDGSGTIASSYDYIGVSGAWNKNQLGYVETPALVSAVGESNGIRFKWKKVSGAAGYKVYRKEGSGSWVGIATLGDTDNYLDTGAVAGKTYTYTVRALDGSNSIISSYQMGGVSGSWNSGIAPGNIAAPKLVSATSEGSGIRVTWQAVAGAAGYKVYRKSDGSWNGLATTSATNYLDNSATSGVTYTYTVRCLNSKGEIISSYQMSGISGAWQASASGALPAPVLKSVEAKTGGVLLTWDKVSGTDQYRVYRKTGSGSWNPLGNVNTENYLDNTAESGVTYTYTVRCVKGGIVASGYDMAGKTITFYSTPTLVSAEAAKDGILIKWNAVGGAPRYLIYRSVDGGTTWSRLATTTGTSYTDKTADPGTEYYYTVRVIHASDDYKFLSDYNHTGVKAKYVGRAMVIEVAGASGGVNVTWSAISGVTKYRVFRKSGWGEWTELADVPAPGTTYKDTKAVSGTTYTYTIRGLDASDKYIGTWDSTGKTITFLEKPTLVKAEREGTGIRFTWEEVEGAAKYRIYRMINGASWVKLVDVTGTSYLDNTVASGVEATYTARCLDALGNIASTYDTTGVKATSPTFYAQPMLTGVKSDVGGIKITWQAVDGVNAYQVFRKDTTKTSWDKQVIVTGATEYLDKDIDGGGSVKEGGKYSYTVACVDSANVVASEYNQTGLSTTYYKAPKMLSAENAVNGVRVTWKAVDGVGAYNIYRKTGNGSWTRIKSAVSGTSYVDSTVRSTEHYNYSVACVVNGTEMSAYDEVGVDTTFYAAPKMISISNVETGVEVKWNSVDGIKDYRVYRKIGNGGWNFLKDESSTGSVVAITDTGVVSGTKYSYAVRCMKGGVLASSYDTGGMFVLYLQAPQLISATSGVKKVTITWSAVSGATSYDIYRKTLVDSGWTKVKDGATGTSFTDTGLTSGITYYYTVVAKNANGDRSNFIHAGISKKAG